MSLPQIYETKIVQTKRFNENTILIELQFEEDKHFEFKAGQFVLVYSSVQNKEEKRAFSIASSPSQKTIELLIRKYDKGKISPILYNIEPNESLKIRGPFGRNFPRLVPLLGSRNIPAVHAGNDAGILRNGLRRRLLFFNRVSIYGRHEGQNNCPITTVHNELPL